MDHHFAKLWHPYASNYHAPFFYQDQLKVRANKMCSKYGIGNSIYRSKCLNNLEQYKKY